MNEEHKISHRINHIVARPSRRSIALPFERETNWRSYEARIKEIIGRNGNSVYQVCVILAKAKSRLDKLPFLQLIEATRVVGYTKSTINRWVEIGADKRLKDPRIAHLLPLEFWRLYALHQIEDQAAFQAALHTGLGVREMDALRHLPKDPGVSVHRDLGDFEANHIYHVDCFDAFERLEEKKVLFDYIITDLPTGKTKKHYDVVVPARSFLMHCKRLLKPRGALTLVISDVDVLEEYLVARHEFFTSCRDWIWQKTLRNNFYNANKDALYIHDYILTLSDGVPMFNPQFTKGKAYSDRERAPSTSTNYGPGASPNFTHNPGRRYPVSVLHIPSVPTRGRLHQQQKPVKLFRKLIKTFTKEGEYVLDPFAGSGTTGKACLECGRKFLLLEKDAENFGKADKRIRAEH